MMMKISQISQNDSTWKTLHHVKSSHYTYSPAFLTNPSSKSTLLSMKQTEGFRILRCAVRFANHTKKRRNVSIYCSAKPALPPSGPPPNITSWIVTIVVALVIPMINHKWGPTLKKKIQSALQTTENVVEAIEKVAEEVEKVAEDIADDLPKGGKLRETVDFIEKFAETAAKDAGLIDDIIDEVQEEEEKAKRSEEEQIKKPQENSNDDSPEKDNPEN